MGKTKKRIKKDIFIQGSLTVEVSLLMPFILFVIWNIIFLSFYLYDHSTALQGCYMTALRTERWLGDIQEKQSEAEKKYEEAVSSKMACAEESQDLQVRDKGVTVGCNVMMNAPGLPFYQSSWEGGHKMTADDFRPVRYIRNIRKLKKAVSAIDGEEN